MEYATRTTRVLLFGVDHDLSAAGALDALSELPKLAVLSIPNARVSDRSLAGLEGAPALTGLTLTGSVDVTDIAPLASLKSLKELKLDKLDKLVDVLPLAGLTSLTDLDLQSSGVQDLAALRGLTAMKNLNVASTDITSLAGIEGMSELQTLNINSNSQLEGRIQPIAGKTQLRTLNMRGVQATDNAVLATLTGLVSLDAMGNGFASLVGVPPVTTANMVFTQQVVNDDPEYVPTGAKEFYYDLTGDLAKRDGSFPTLGGNMVPEFNPTFPKVTTRVLPAWGEIYYTFEDFASAMDRYSGRVIMPIIWSDFTNEDSASAKIGVPWTFQLTTTDGFDVVKYSADDALPDWIALDSASGVLTGTPPAAADSWFTVRGVDDEGNEVSQRFNIVVENATSTYLDIESDRTGTAGEDIVFTVTRSADADTGYTGAAFVKFMTVDGTAKSGEHYKYHANYVEWEADDFEPKTVTVETFATAPGEPDREFELQLYSADPQDLAVIGSGEVAVGTITSVEANDAVFTVEENLAVDAGGDAVLQITRTNADTDAWTGPVTVGLTTADETAVAGTHYEALDTELTWAQGETGTKEVRVKTLPTAAGDPAREFDVFLHTPSEHAAIGDPGRTHVEIVAPTPELSEFTFASATESTRAGDEAVLTVKREDAQVHPWKGAASVRVTTADGSATAGKHYASVDELLEWEAGDATPRQIRVQTTGGFNGDLPREFTVALSDASVYTQFGDIPVVDVTVAYEPNGSEGPGDADGNGGGPDEGGSGGSGASGDQGSAASRGDGELSNTGANGLLAGMVSAAALLAAGLVAMLAQRMRRHE